MCKWTAFLQAKWVSQAAWGGGDASDPAILSTQLGYVIYNRRCLGENGWISPVVSSLPKVLSHFLAALCVDILSKRTVL